MRGIKKAAIKSNGLRRCNGTCKFSSLVSHHYYEEICDVCWKSFIDGFEKGARFVEHKNKENEKRKIKL